VFGEQEEKGVSFKGQVQGESFFRGVEEQRKRVGVKLIEEKIKGEWFWRFWIGDKEDLSAFKEVEFVWRIIKEEIKEEIICQRTRKPERVAVKVQYLGVGRSIDSDLDNLLRLMKFTGAFPKGAYLENLINYTRAELKEECDYRIELKKQQRYSETNCS
jgi:hypothetical protein